MPTFADDESASATGLDLLPPSLAFAEVDSIYWGEVARLRAAERKGDESAAPTIDRLNQALMARAESFRRYTDACALHIVPEIGTVAVNRLTPIQVQTAYSRLASKGLSGTTIQLIHGVLHKALDDAVRWDVVVRNVTDMVDAPRRSTVEVRALNPSEARLLLEAAKGDPLEAFYITALTTGLRLGELQALRWSDVDMSRRRLQVVATYQGMADGRPQFAEPKTARSRRGIHLSEMAVAALRDHRAGELAKRLKAGPAWHDYGLVFTNAIGRPLDGDYMRKKSFAALLDRAGLPPMRFHDLRHAAATILMSDGVPVKAISEMLGHSDITTTLRIYAHVLPTAHDQAAASMDRQLGGSRAVIGGQLGGQRA